MKNILILFSISLFFVLASCSEDEGDPPSKLIKGYWEAEYKVNDTIVDIYFYTNCDCNVLDGAGIISKYAESTPDDKMTFPTWLSGTFENPLFHTSFLVNQHSQSPDFGNFVGSLNSINGTRDSIAGWFYPTPGDSMPMVFVRTEER
jgi:hypothetical protein